MASRFIISLDFELHWGVFDHTPLSDRSKAYFRTARALVPETLSLFRQHGIQATWATVGVLFAPDRASLWEVLPSTQPAYHHQAYNPYPLIEIVGENEKDDPYHYAGSLIRQIAATPGQEIGSHTFSHYYCLEPGQDITTFQQDLQAARFLAEKYYGISLKSLVFPRNQFSENYVSTILAEGFETYRTNPDIWFWKANTPAESSIWKKTCRLLDHYISIDRDTSFLLSCENKQAIPASRLFRPYIAKIDGFGRQSLKIKRICDEMTCAAETARNYHLWWHPHNLATHPAKNMEALTHILQHYRYLEKEYGMQSCNMENLYQQ